MNQIYSKTMSNSGRLIILGAGMFFLLSANFSAQETINKEVVVVKPYEPTLSDASRIQILPDFNDSVVLNPDFNYRILSRPLSADFKARPIQAARMENEPLPELYNTFLKIGFGSYVTPLLQLNINSLREKTHSLGLQVSHRSSQGKIRLDNEQKVFAGYGDNEISLFGKKIFKNAIFSGNMGFASRTRYFYGYNTSLDSVVKFEKDDIKQRYLGFDAEIGLKSNHLDSTRLNYRFDGGFRYLQDSYSHHAETYSLEGSASRMFARGYFGLDTRVFHQSATLVTDSVDFTMLTIHPWWAKTTPEYRLKVGLDITALTGPNSGMHFYPNASMQFKVVENILVPYLGVSGQLEDNHFYKISMENMYTTPGQYVKPTDHKLEFFGGIKGNLSTAVSFNLKASYALTDDMYFFVNDTTVSFDNSFRVEYDDVELMNYYAELVLYPTDRISVHLKGHYYKYTMATSGMRPWHMPSFDAGLSLRYNLRNKILLHSDVLVYGKRYARNLRSAGEAIELKGFADVNLELEYRYTKILSGFLAIHNLTSQRYFLYNQYPLQRFFIMAGFTYSM